MKRRHTYLKRQYPNIYDMQLNLAFHMKRCDSTNRFNHFYNLLGDRKYVPGLKLKYSCEICGAPIQKRRRRMYLVCKHCLRKYIHEVKVGKRVAQPYVEVYAR